MFAISRRQMLLSAVAGPLARSAESHAFHWRREEGSLALLTGDQILWQFRHGKNEAKPAFHPIALTGGPVMTCYRNDDHPWHRGLWFSWKLINGINYWEEDKNGLAEGITETSNVKAATRPDHSARITLDVAYHAPKEKPLLLEKRSIDIGKPDASGSFRLDWAMTFTAQEEDVLLDRTPITGEPNGKGSGGYSGLAVRFPRDTTEIQVLTSNGRAVFPEQGYRGIRTKAPGADYSGLVEGQVVGIAMIGHPGNLNAPTPWWVIDNQHMKFFNPSVLEYAPYTLSAGRSLTLRYRVIPHFGRFDSDRLAHEVDNYERSR